MTGYVSLDAYEQFCENYYEDFGLGANSTEMSSYLQPKNYDMFNHPARAGLHEKEGIKQMAMSIFDNAKELVKDNPVLATAVAATAVAGGTTAGILGHRARKKRKAFKK